jgi:hypothetical protein
MTKKTDNVRVTSHPGPFVKPFLQWKSKEYYTIWVCVCSLRYPSCNAHAPYCHLWPAPLYRISAHSLIKGTFFEKKKLQNTKCGSLSFSATFVWNISHSKKKWARCDKNVCLSSCKVPLFLIGFNETLMFWADLFFKFSNIKFYEIPPPPQWGHSCSVRTDRHDEADSHFLQFCKAPKN